MSILTGKYEYYRERIRLGSMSIKNYDLPFVTFLIGIYLPKVDGNIDILFDFFDILEELKEQKLLSQILRIQLLRLVEEYPKELKKIIHTLTQYKNGKQINIIEWIEKFFNGDSQLIIQQPAQSPNNALNNDGTLELSNSYTQQLNQKVTQKKEDQERDIQLARKMQEQFDKEKKPADGQEVPCQICYCGLFQENFDGPEQCGHIFHTNCMRESFKMNILSNNFPIICLKEDCKKEVSDADLRRILDAPLFEKYQNHTLKAYADSNGDSISWCPTANCTYMFFYQKNDNERFECLECKKQYCLNCRVEWHKQMTCKEYKVSSTTSEEDKQFIEFVKGKKFKQCPKCKFWVQRNQGCDHMTCKCKFQFCYKCGGIYMKCQCVQQQRLLMQRRRVEAEERRVKKQQRKRTAAEKARIKAQKAQEVEKKRQPRSRRKK